MSHNVPRWMLGLDKPHFCKIRGVWFCYYRQWYTSGRSPREALGRMLIGGKL
jgi:hypothetical protein